MKLQDKLKDASVQQAPFITTNNKINSNTTNRFGQSRLPAILSDYQTLQVATNSVAIHTTKEVGSWQ